MATGSPQYRMADRLTEGRLAEILLDYKAAGHSFEHATRLLWSEHNIEVTRQTVAAWTKYAETEMDEVAS